ncbi:MAG TPA: metallophosphoesterase [Polyangiales bacterium]|nr:metallophosphoesterase [Polyangiales bacterium]
MKLFAISDVHVEHAVNREALAGLAPQPEDWLILAGDISDSVSGLAWALDTLGPKFARLLWVPGNHDLWIEKGGERGVARYQQLIDTCRARSVLTPEDPYVAWPEHVDGRRVRIALMFLLYDYSFAPDEHTGRERAIEWAAEEGILAADEVRLVPDPYPSRTEWCRARVSETALRLARCAGDALVLVNHWPLRRDLVRLGRVPRYSPWCGTRATEDWHLRYSAIACVHGHLHVRATDERDGVRFEEVSLGYPAHWDHARGAVGYLRQIL